MEPKLADELQKTADILHWFGKYRESTVLTLLARHVRAVGLDTVEDLTKYVEKYEDLNLRDNQ